MSVLEAADKVEIRILVDNATDMLSSNPPFVESEAAFLTAARLQAQRVQMSVLCGARAVSAFLTVHRGDIAPHHPV